MTTKSGTVKRKVKRRSSIAVSLAQRQHRQRIVPNKRRKPPLTEKQFIRKAYDGLMG